MKKALVIGADGAIGDALCRYLKGRGWQVEGTVFEGQAGDCDSSFCLDLAASPEAWPDLAAREPDAVFLMAAVSALGDCAANPEETWAINVEHTVELAQRMTGAGAFVVFPSTNLVFDGETPDCPADMEKGPICEYGRQKAAAEDMLLALGAKVAVVRLAKVLSPEMALVAGWRESLTRGARVRAFSDLKLAPVSLEYTLEVLTSVAEREADGIFQISAPEEISYGELAMRMAKEMGADPALVDCVTSVDAGVTLEASPRHVRLDDSRVVAELGLPAPGVEQVLKLVC